MHNGARNSAIVAPAPDDDFQKNMHNGARNSAIVAPAPDDDFQKNMHNGARNSAIVAPAPDDDFQKNMHNGARNSAIVAPAPDDDFLPPHGKHKFEVQNTRTSDLAGKIAQIAPAPLNDEQNFLDTKRNVNWQALKRWRNMQAVVKFLKKPKKKKKGGEKIVSPKNWKANMNHGTFQVRNITKSEDVMDRKNDEAESPEHSERTKHQEGWREVGRNIIESNYYEILIVALTFVALFMEDVETLMLTGTFRDTDTYDLFLFHLFGAMRVAFFVIFLLDLVAGSIFKFNYNFKLVWWLDFVSAISMLPMENLTFDGGFSLNYLVALKAFKVARATRLLKMLRVVRLAKIVRLLRAINLSKKKVDQKSFVIGDQEEKNDEGQVNADHLKEQLVSMITVKVLLMILMLMFGLPIIAMAVGDSCYNLEKTNMKIINGMEQLHIMFSNTQFHDSQKSCDMDPFCKTSIATFRQVTNPYLRLYVSNITLAGKEWCDISLPECPAFNYSAVRGSKDFYNHVCFVMHNNKRINCAGCEFMLNCCLDCEVCAPCYSGYTPTSNKTQVDTYSFTVDTSTIDRWEAQNSILQVVLLVLVMLACVYIFKRYAGHLSTDIGEPVKLLAKDMERVSHMVFEPQSKKMESSLYEVTKIIKSFSKMKGVLQSFAKFVPRELVRYLVLKGEDARINMNVRELTIFFSDIASFTTICESLGAKELYLLLSSYFEEMSKIIVDSNGTLIEYIGDAILAVWNAPMPVEDHACLGVCSTLIMQERLRFLREQWQTTVYNSSDRKHKELPNFNVRCGLHTAVAFVGNMGSPARMKYGVAGGSLATAGMLEELNKTYDTRILISEDTYGHSSVQETVLCRLIDYAVVEEDEDEGDGDGKGDGESEKKTDEETLIIGIDKSNVHQVHDDVRKVEAVYEPLGLRTDMHITAVIISELHNKAFEFYRQRLFPQAADSFAQALRLCEQNPSLEISGQPAAVLHKRCLEFAARPPPPEWNLLSPEQIYYVV